MDDQPSSATLTRDGLADLLAGVPGWLHPAEAWQLHEMARLHPEPGPVTAVEIGSYLGRSSISLGRGIAARPNGGRVIAIDPFDVLDGQLASFTANVGRAGVGALVEPIAMFSHDARPRIADGSVHVLYIDGDHNYPGIIADIDDWTSALVDGAVVGFNDPFLIGVAHALRDRLCNSRSPFRNPRWLVNTVYADHLPNAPWTPEDERRSRRLRVFLAAGRRWHGLKAWRRPDYDVPKPYPRGVVAIEQHVIGPVLERVLPLASSSRRG